MSAKVRTHYHVVENTPGYMPDSDPAVCQTLTEARTCAAGLAKELRADDYHVSGSARSGYYYAERDSSDLGRVIEIIPCTDAECEEYIDRF